MKNLSCILLLITCLFINGYGQSRVTFTDKKVSLPTYTVRPADKNPYFFRGEGYQGASRHYYPLKLNDQFTGERSMQEHQFLTLENEYIELAVTPEFGGKLYYVTDKTNNYRFYHEYA